MKHTTLSALALGAAALAFASPSQAAVFVGGFTLDTGSFGTGLGVHSNGTQSGPTIGGAVNIDDSAVTFSTTSGNLSITGSGEATVYGDPGMENLKVVFAKGWDSITFDFEKLDSDAAFTMLVNGTALYDSGNCSLCVIGNGANKFTISGTGITELAFNFDPAISDAKQFRVEGVSIVPLPEPASWAMLIAGLGIVGAAMRRRKTEVSFG
jgi:hypothetical protein